MRNMSTKIELEGRTNRRGDTAMPTRFLNLLFVSVLFVMFCISCGSKEREARDMLIQSQRFLEEERWVELEKHLNRITSEYPETKAAAVAAEMRYNMVQRANKIAETTLKGAFVSGMGYLVSYPDEELTMEKIQEFGFKPIEVVEIEVVRGEADDFLITSEHVVGDRVYSVGPDGKIEHEEYEGREEDWRS
jgi:hypothetical protein